MASLVFSAHELVKNAEAEIFKAYDAQKFQIDKNSSVTNVNVIDDMFASKIISEKASLQASSLSLGESVLSILGPVTVFLKLLKRDIVYTYKNSSVDEVFSVVMKLLEYMVLTMVIVLSILWLFAPLV